VFSINLISNVCWVLPGSPGIYSARLKIDTGDARVLLSGDNHERETLAGASGSAGRPAMSYSFLSAIANALRQDLPARSQETVILLESHLTEARVAGEYLAQSFGRGAVVAWSAN
jgi:hypothetical protein